MISNPRSCFIKSWNIQLSLRLVVSGFEARQVGCVDLCCGGAAVRTSHPSEFFLGPGLNLLLWTELLFSSQIVSSGVFHLKGARVMLFLTALPGVPEHTKWRWLGMSVSKASCWYRMDHSYHCFSGELILGEIFRYFSLRRHLYVKIHIEIISLHTEFLNLKICFTWNGICPV